jgi:hypothetical protein
MLLNSRSTLSRSSWDLSPCIERAWNPSTRSDRVSMSHPFLVSTNTRTRSFGLQFSRRMRIRPWYFCKGDVRSEAVIKNTPGHKRPGII